MKLKNPFLFFIILIFCIMNLLDIVTSYFIVAGEANPIYLLTGSLNLLSAFKIGILLIAIFVYRSNTFKSHMSYFMLISILVMSILMFGLAVFGNFYGMNDPAVVQAASQIAPKERVQNYFMFVGIIYVLPYGLSVLSFWIYDKSKKYVNWVNI